eukprot:scaffold6711_cov118-Isochrysis_galbana.AAC.33
MAGDGDPPAARAAAAAAAASGGGDGPPSSTPSNGATRPRHARHSPAASHAAAAVQSGTGSAMRRSGQRRRSGGARGAWDAPTGGPTASRHAPAGCTRASITRSSASADRQRAPRAKVERRMLSVIASGNTPIRAMRGRRLRATRHSPARSQAERALLYEYTSGAGAPPSCCSIAVSKAMAGSHSAARAQAEIAALWACVDRCTIPRRPIASSNWSARRHAPPRPQAAMVAE